MTSPSNASRSPAPPELGHLIVEGEVGARAQGIPAALFVLHLAFALAHSGDDFAEQCFKVVGPARCSSRSRRAGEAVTFRGKVSLSRVAGSAGTPPRGHRNNPGGGDGA